MGTIHRTSVHDRGFSHVHGARLQFLKMPYGAHRKTTLLTGTIQRKSVHDRGFSHVHGARLLFFEMHYGFLDRFVGKRWLIV